MTKIEVFEKFIKHHDPIISKRFNNMYMFCFRDCSTCKAKYKCDQVTPVSRIKLDEKDMKEIGLKYPELLL